MTPTGLDVYARQLRRELRRRFIVDDRLVDEAHGHLCDAVERAIEQGMMDEAAVQLAVQRFGPPAVVAASVAADRTRALHRGLFLAAIVAGLVIAYIDARPTWDDTGVTAGALMLAAALASLAGPRRPWLWALAVGSWIPVGAVISGHALSVGASVPVLIAVMGAYGGWGIRRLAVPT